MLLGSHEVIAGGMITDLFKKNKLSMADRAKAPVEDTKKSSGKWW